MGRLSVLPDGVCFLQASPVLKISSGAESTAIGSQYAYMLMGLDRDGVYRSAGQLDQELRRVAGSTACRAASSSTCRASTS